MAPELRDNWQATYTGLIRSIQSAHQDAHLAMRQWGAWSRCTGAVPGLTNGVTAPGLWWQASPGDPSDWAEPGDQGVARRAQREIKPEPAERELYDVRLGERMDRIIHAEGFPAVWRLIARTAYIARLLEYQFPGAARMSHENFARQLGAMLDHLGAS